MDLPLGSPGRGGEREREEAVEREEAGERQLQWRWVKLQVRQLGWQKPGLW